MAALREVVVSACFIFCFNTLPFTLATSDQFHEELLVKPLPDGQLYHHFQFTTTWNTSLFTGSAEQGLHFHLFPKSLGEVLAKFSVQELHLSMTHGLWKHDKWGYPIEDAPPGAELVVWFKEGTNNVDEMWTELINVLSGLFCASLNFMDGKNTVTPKLSFRPEGVVSERYDRVSANLVRFAALPNEIVCTENLTPWKKLLPCGSRAGLASLFNAVKLYDTSYHSLGLHFKPICMDPDCGFVGVELHQSLGVVMETAVKNTGKPDWSFKKNFERMLSSSCPLATTSIIFVDIITNKTEFSFTLTPEPVRVRDFKKGTALFRYAIYNINDYVDGNRVLNIEAKYRQPLEYKPSKKPMIHAQRFQTGFGQEKGGVMCLIYNNHKSKDMTVTYMEVVPWFLRVYYHTLKVETFQSGTTHVGVNGTTSRPLFTHYVPGKDRLRPYHLEVILYLPANSVTRLSFEFDRALLKWTEYPPDANHGFYVNSAVISGMLPYGGQYTAPPQTSSRIQASMYDDSTSYFVRLHTETLLVTLPTPDFSMPYNVICLACTVVAIAFGSFHNLTTRRFVIKDPSKQKGFLTKLKEKVFGKKPVAIDVADTVDKNKVEDSEEKTHTHSEESGDSAPDKSTQGIIEEGVDDQT